MRAPPASTRRRLPGVLLTLALAGFAPQAFAQVAPTRQTAPGPVQPASPLQAPHQTGPALRNPPHEPVHASRVAKPGPSADEARAKVRQKLRAIRSRKIAEIIQPEPTTMLKLAEIAEKFGEQLDQKRADAQATRKALQKASQAPRPDVAEISKLSAQFIAQRNALAELETAREQAVRAVLTPVDFAKWLLAWPKINREMREEIYKALAKKQARDDDF